MTIPEICKVTGGQFFDNKNFLWKWIGEEWVGKYAIQTKDLTIKWFEDVNPEEIDTRYYNLDGTKK